MPFPLSRFDPIHVRHALRGSAKFVAKPVNQGGRALMHMETLTELAMER
jgi:hypothetical protein